MDEQIYGWQRYLGIEQEFITAREYVSLEQDNTYSEFFTRAVIIFGAEIEGAFKTICKNLMENESGNIGQYKETILSNYPGIVDLGCSIRGSNRELFPFKEWNLGKLNWWDVYSHVKHSLVDKNATCFESLQMLAAYQLCLFIVEAGRGNYSERDYIRAYSAVDAPKLLVPHMEFVAAQDSDGILNTAFNPYKLVKRLKN